MKGGRRHVISHSKISMLSHIPLWSSKPLFVKVMVTGGQCPHQLWQCTLVSCNVPSCIEAIASNVLFVLGLCFHSPHDVTIIPECINTLRLDIRIRRECLAHTNGNMCPLHAIRYYIIVHMRICLHVVICQRAAECHGQA